MNERVIASLDDMGVFAGDMLADVSERSRDRATIFALEGELGAGKTAFVKALARALGVVETVTSPTFVLMKTYSLRPAAHSTFEKLVHVDAYRLESTDELMALGWADIIKDSGTIIALEWPERVPGAIPSDAINLSFSYVNDTTRSVVINM